VSLLPLTILHALAARSMPEAVREEVLASLTPGQKPDCAEIAGKIRAASSGSSRGESHTRPPRRATVARIEQQVLNAPAMPDITDVDNPPADEVLSWERCAKQLIVNLVDLICQRAFNVDELSDRRIAGLLKPAA
jgi:hypothetical protein